MNYRPRTGTMVQHAEYWARQADPAPDGAFEFVSVHRNSFPDDDGRPVFALMGPARLSDPLTSKRPDWEKEKFGAKPDAVRRARQIARAEGMFVVDCV
jgi:hypothetical protein